MVAQPFLATLTAVGTGEQLIFPATHQRLPRRESIEELSWRTLRGGTVRQPRPGGEIPKEYTLTAWLPGGTDYGEPWALPDVWRPPRDVRWQLSVWLSFGTELRYLVTETDIDDNVFLTALGSEWGELDRVHFDITMVQMRALYVEVFSASEAQEESSQQSNSGTSDRYYSISARARALRRAGEPMPLIPDIFIVSREGMTLPMVALLCYDDSARWPEIANINKTTLDALNLGPAEGLPAGTRLKVPGGQNTQTVPAERGSGGRWA